MREYEIVYIFRPEMESEDVEDRLESFHERLDGEVEAVEHWGQRELAFEIEGERRGYYAVTQFRAEPSSLDELEEALDRDRDLIRHLLVLSEGEVPTPPSRRREEEEEDEEEDDEEEKEQEDEDGGEEEERDAEEDDEPLDEDEGDADETAGDAGEDETGAEEDEDEEAAEDEDREDEEDETGGEAADETEDEER